MRINLEEVDKDIFNIAPKSFFGEEVFLITPKETGHKWTQKDKIFRSSVWNKEGYLISAGFPKFTNWGENEENFPLPKDLNNCVVVDKLDGSLLIVSKYKGNYIIRTREGMDAYKLQPEEIKHFKDTILNKIEDMAWSDYENTWHISVLFEWYSPSKRIIVNYGPSPKFWLIGVVNHRDYSICTQSELNLAAEILGVERPNNYNIPSIEALMENVKEWKGKEGVCVYSHIKGQNIHKVKSGWYLLLHKARQSFSSINNIFDTWVKFGKPTELNDLESAFVNNFDFELWQCIKDDCRAIRNAYVEYLRIKTEIENLINKGSLLMKTRKEFAAEILSNFKRFSDLAFKILDNKEISEKEEKELVMRVFKLNS